MQESEYNFHARFGDSDWWQWGMRQAVLSLLDPAFAGARALDIGSGAGYLVRELRSLGWDARGVDVSPQVAAGAAGLGLAQHVTVGDINELLPQLPSFRLVTLLDVLSHRLVSEEILLRSLRPHLCPGAQVVLRLPAHPSLYGGHDLAADQTHRYDRARVEKLAAAADLRVERLSYGNCTLFPLYLARVSLNLSRAAPSSLNQSPPRFVNSVFRSILAAEAAWLGRGWNLPFGSSLLVSLRERNP